MKIAIDIDEVVAEFTRGYIQLLKRKGIEAEYEKTFSYNFWESYPISKEEAFKFADEFFESDDFENIDLVNGAKEAITLLEKSNEIFFVTSRPNYIEDKTHKFIAKHFPNSRITLIFSGDLHTSNGRHKNEICKALNARVLIEDNKDYALDCANSGIKVILISRPWNLDFNEKNYPNIQRANNWEEILKMLS